MKRFFTPDLLHVGLIFLQHIHFINCNIPYTLKRLIELKDMEDIGREMLMEMEGNLHFIFLHFFPHLYNPKKFVYQIFHIFFFLFFLFVFNTKKPFLCLPSCSYVKNFNFAIMYVIILSFFIQIYIHTCVDEFTCVHYNDSIRTQQWSSEEKEGMWINL